MIRMKNSTRHDNDVESSGDEKARVDTTAAGLSQAKSGSEVPWTLTRIIAIASLCGVYVGEWMSLDGGV